MTARKYRGVLYNVGPIVDDQYSGVHSYSQVLFPFINECVRRGIEFTWVGETIQNSSSNITAIRALVRDGVYCAPVITAPQIVYSRVSKDLLKAEDFDFLFLQPRPLENILESTTVDFLIRKFVDAKKRVFLFEQDMFPISDKWKDSEYVTHLRPFFRPQDDRWKDSREFLFWHSPYAGNLHFSRDEVKRRFDFIYIGNVYGRQAAFQKFLGGLQTSNNVIFGNWVSSPDKRAFAEKPEFVNLNFCGSTDHNFTIPLMNAAPFTIQILPEHAAEVGLMTARVFNAVSAKMLCFADAAIYGAEKIFPKELIVANAAEMNDRIAELQRNPAEYRRVLDKRDEMMKEHSVFKRVETFKKMLEELV